ncbi:MAG: MTH938/NDUFAF3 family protein [Spirochaetia bacterium]|jgi:hypothetical protein
MIDKFSFGSIRIDGVTYEHDVVIEHGDVRKRKKKASKELRNEFGHTPLSIAENIPWGCRCIVVGTGANGALPVMDEVRSEAIRRGVELVVAPTEQAVELLNKQPEDTNAVLHITC